MPCKTEKLSKSKEDACPQCGVTFQHGCLKFHECVQTVTVKVERIKPYSGQNPFNSEEYRASLDGVRLSENRKTVKVVDHWLSMSNEKPVNLCVGDNSFSLSNFDRSNNLVMGTSNVESELCAANIICEPPDLVYSGELFRCQVKLSHKDSSIEKKLKYTSLLNPGSGGPLRFLLTYEDKSGTVSFEELLVKICSTVSSNTQVFSCIGSCKVEDDLLWLLLQCTQPATGCAINVLISVKDQILCRSKDVDLLDRN